MGRSIPSVRLFVFCEDEALRFRIDDLLAALPTDWVRVEERMRVQDADVVLVVDVAPAQARAKLERAGSDASVIRCLAGPVDGEAFRAAVAELGDACEEVLGLDEPPLRWARTLDRKSVV